MKKNKKMLNFNKISKKFKSKKMLSKLKIPLIAAAVIIVSVIAVKIPGKVKMSNVTDTLKAIPSLFSSSDSFPYYPDSISFRRADLIGDDLLIITDDSSKVISSAAKEKLHVQLTAADTKAVTKNSRALLFSGSSNDVILQSKTEKLGTIKSPSPVRTADIAKNGSFAISYPGENAQSTVEVYNTRLQKLFQWNCSNEYISSLALSGSGKKIAVAAVGSKNAILYSRIILFGIKDTKPSAEIKLDGTVVLRLIYTSSNKIIAIGDNKTVLYNTSGKIIGEIDYTDTSLVAADCDDSGNTVILFRSNGGASYEAVRFASRGKMVCRFALDYEPKTVSVRSNRFAISDGSTIYTYLSNGHKSKTVECKSSTKQILVSSNNIYTVEGNSVCKY